MKALLIIVLALFVSACGTQQIVKVPVEVPIEIVTKCKVKYPEKPQATPADKLPSDYYGQGAYLIKENTDFKTYSWKLEAALKSCAEPE